MSFCHSVTIDRFDEAKAIRRYGGRFDDYDVRHNYNIGDEEDRRRERKNDYDEYEYVEDKEYAQQQNDEAVEHKENQDLPQKKEREGEEKSLDIDVGNPWKLNNPFFFFVINNMNGFGIRLNALRLV